MIDLETVRAIEAVIDDLADEFRRAPGLLLTEADLKCQLMAKIGQVGGLGVPVPSADEGVLATSVHAEVPWFDNNNQLMLRPDITITDPRHLSIRRAMQRGIRFPRKGFHFVGDSLLLELKFYRDRSGVPPTALPVIQGDIDKITRLVERGRSLSPETFLRGIVVVFAKYSDVCPEIAALARRGSGPVTVIVRSAGLGR